MKKRLKKLTSVLAAFAITAMCLPCMPAVTVEAATATLKQTNIMSSHDPGFESGTFTKDGVLWNASGTNACSTEQKHSGTYSLKSSDNQAYSGPQALLNNLTVGAKYYVSVWVYTADSGLKAKIGQMDNTGSGGASKYESNKSLTAGDWTQLSATIEAKYTSIKLVINFDTGTRTTPAYFDDFEVIPVNVEGNLVANPGFELGTNSSWTAKDYWTVVENPIADNNTGSFVSKTVDRVSLTNLGYRESRTPQQSVAIEPDTYYYISAAVAQATASDTAETVIMRLQQSAPSGATKITIPSSYTTINTTSYTDVKAVVYNKDATAANVYVQTSTSANYPDIYVDNAVVAPIEIKSYTEGGAGIIPNGDITLSVPEDIAVTASSITINNGAKVMGVKRSGRDCVVSFTGMEKNTTYKLTLNTGLNLSPSWSFTTGDYTNELETLGYDPDFETISVDDSKYAWKYTVTEATDKAASGLRSFKVTGRAGEQCGPMAKSIQVTPGEIYYVSAWLYTDSADSQARIRWQGSTLPSAANFTAMTAGQWNHITQVIEVPDTYDYTNNVFFYVQEKGISAATTYHDVYVDNFEIINLTPPPAATTVISPQNGAPKVSVDTDLKLIFSQAVNGVAASNIVISGGTASVGTVTSSTDSKTFTVDLGTLAPNTTYTATVTGVVDVNGNTVADTAFTFTTAHAGYENLLVTQGYDPGFETGLDNYHLKGTVERTDARVHSGSYAARATSRTGGYFGARAIVDLEENTEYLMAAWVYTESSGEAIQMRLQGADAGAIGDFKTITAGQWNYVTATTNTSSDQSVVEDAYFYPNTKTYNDIWVDDYELVKIGKIPSSDIYSFNSESSTVILKKAYTEKYSNMEDVADDIIGSEDYIVTATDVDGSGDWTTGDKLILTPKAAGEAHNKVYTADVRDYYDSSTEALIVKGSDGIGDDFCYADTITKSGKAFIEYRVENNASGTITPAVVAAVYDEDGRFLEMDVADAQTISQNTYKDFEMEVTIPANAEGATLKLMVWDSLTSMVPLMAAKVYTVDTNNFTIPTVISNNMVLQRNAEATIYGSAPEYSTVTATLSGGTTASYTVPKGDSEFFVKLPMGDANATEQTLTITATDKSGESLGSFTRTGVLVGDVFYGSGQSNMARQFKATAEGIQAGSSKLYTADKYDAYVAEYKALGEELSTKNVRFYKSRTEDTVASRASKGEAHLVENEYWRTIDESNIDDTYNMMVRMAAEIKNAEGYENVPIGIVACAQGGTIAAKWVSRDTFFAAGFNEEYDNYENNVTRANSSSYWASHTDLYYDGARAVLPYTVKAAVWYQGQSDNSSNYDKYLSGVIHDIRESQKNDNLPVLVMGLFGSTVASNTSGWPIQRLGQLNAANQLTNVYTTTINDTGDPSAVDPYHPANDADVAHRAARSMLANVYGDGSIKWEGPEFASATYGAGSATITVNTNGGTLGKYTTTDGSPNFELTTDGGATWTSADSIAVNGDTITVSSSSITDTVNGVRYAMTAWRIKCIYGTYTDAMGTDEILPLVPFDTTYVPNTLSYK